MSEVTAKDLRHTIGQYWHAMRATSGHDSGLLALQLAAFDAMAEKAETLRLLESQLAQGARLRRQGDDMEEEYGDYEIYIPLRYGGKHYSGKTLTEALKAVPE